MNTMFDNVIERRNTNSLKHDFSMEYKHRDDLLPLWIADMDFKAPEAVLEDLHRAVSHGVLGYSEVKEAYFAPIRDWFHIHFGWDAQEDWLVKSPGIVFAIVIAIHAFTKENDGVMLQQPIYHPFISCILDNNRKLVNNQLHYENGRYTIDFDDFEQKIIKEKVKLFLFCSPHNPTGRVWTREELTRIGEICLKHKVLVLSDEIHCDFTYPGHTHTVFASMCEEFAMNSIICTSPSKTFNLPGLQLSNIFIPNPDIRKKYKQAFNASGYSQANVLSLVACQSAYEKGGPWLKELKEYLKGNLDFLKDFLKTNIPSIQIVEPEGTYLVWLDFSGLGLTYKELESLLIDKAKVWLSGGITFGSESALFERINLACPRSILEKALHNLDKAIKEW